MSVELRIFLVVALIVILLAVRPDWRAKLKAMIVPPSPLEPEKGSRSAAGATRGGDDEVVVGDRPAAKPRTPPPKKIGGGLEERLAKVGDLELWYLSGGRGEGRPMVLLLHGMTGDKEQWIPLMGQLMSEGYQVVAPDLPGCGQNEKDLKAAYDVTSQVKQLRKFIARLALTPLHLVGSSIGGTLAAALAYSLKDDASSLTLIEPFGLRVPYETELGKLLEQNRNPFLIASPTAYENLLAFLCASPPAEDPRQVARAKRAAEGREIHQKIWQEMCEGDRANLLDVLLPELKTRTLYLQGAESKVVHPKTAELVPTLMSNARSEVIADCGHLPMVEKPDETAKHLVDFLDQT